MKRPITAARPDISRLLTDHRISPVWYAQHGGPSRTRCKARISCGKQREPDWVARLRVDNTNYGVYSIPEENVRDVLAVTLAKGEFLDMVNNKAWHAPNIVLLLAELMQLFTLGLTTLNPDGQNSCISSRA